MSIASSWGRRKLRQNPLRLTFAGRVFTEVSTLCVLGVDFTSGSASPWLRTARKSASSMLHLFRRISQRGVCVCVQFQHLIQAEWTRLETLHREAMRVIKDLPRLTPAPTLQAEA
ncbi:hypothetical protein HPB47_011017, partial [Ixodes persulcatus]